jgi:hypothetical protein
LLAPDALALVLVPALAAADAEEDEEDAAPWMPELQASSRAPPPTTAAPTPAARNRLRRETRPPVSWLSVDWLSVLSWRAVWSVIVWDLSL